MHLPKWLALAVLAGGSFAVGCQRQPVDTGPSYADLVVTFNAELAALDRLEAKREKLVSDFESEVTA
ncbi:MAG: hypothetical protein KDB27_35415, partial [Planctomycetales bacterium]|nr:hypothetical protein [Planctomycetales bacterium]